ncbi:MAG: hypothetical protein HYS13_07675 [Planctomycetia bacterium]|nr:hypothetical protein [Planctomycetia bacterium]
MVTRTRKRTVADQITYWYRLKAADIERIEFEDSFERDSFVIRPSHVKFFPRKARRVLYPGSHPLTMIGGHQSPLLTEHLAQLSKQRREWAQWLRGQITSIVQEHERVVPSVDERDLLRSSGALEVAGIKLGMYRAKGIDCPDARFELGGYPEYACPIEVEERSSGFLAPHHDRHRKQRVVLMCMTHDAPEVLRGYVDVLELRELRRVLDDVA